MAIFFIGDELVAGFGDARALGWTGRVMARTRSEPPLMPITLAVPGEDTAALAKRWGDEVARRLRHDEDNRLIIGLGSHDLDSGQTLARARLHLANILDAAARMKLRSFIVGPPPRREVPFKIQLDLSKAFGSSSTNSGTPTYRCLAATNHAKPATASSHGWFSTMGGTIGWESQPLARLRLT